MKNTREYEKFKNLAHALFSVPHAEIKKKLDAEKQEKKRKKAKKSSASREEI
jgi:hypothetical protein